jgi:transposase-like protein
MARNAPADKADNTTTTDTPEVKAPDVSVLPSIPDVDALLAATRSQYEAQAEALRPYADAYERVMTLIENFEAVSTGKIGRGGRVRSGERAARGSRGEEFLSVVRDAGDNGVTVAEAADRMDGMNPNYLYRLAAAAVEDGTIRKDDASKRYFFVGDESDPEAEATDQTTEEEAEQATA